MAEREYVRTDESLDNARRNGVSLEEVTEALYAPPGLRYERTSGTCCSSSPALPPAVESSPLCDRTGATHTYKIIDARALRGADLDEWRSRVR